MKIYIAGPITGREKEEAFEHFERAENDLLRLGFDPVNPMKKVSEQEGKTWAEYMKEDIPLLVACDAVLMLDRWQGSPGATLEHHIAKELGLYIVYENAGGRVAGGECLAHFYRDGEVVWTHKFNTGPK